MTKKTVEDKREYIDIYSGKIHDLVYTLQDYLKLGYSVFNLDLDWQGRLDLIKYRQETDAEYEARLARERKAKDRQEKRKQASLDRKRKQYEKLKQLFEGDNA